MPFNSSRYSCSTCGQKTSSRGLAEELPILLLLVGHLGRDRFEVVLDFGGQQVAVLEADLGGRAFQVDLDPAVAFGRARTPSSGADRVCGFARDQRDCQGQQQHDGGKKGGASHPAIIVGAAWRTLPSFES